MTIDSYETLKFGAPEGYSTITQFCAEQHREQGSNCSAIGRCIKAEILAQLSTQVSESEPLPAPSFVEIRRLMEEQKQRT